MATDASTKPPNDGGPEITSSITKEAADDRGLVEGSKVPALIEATEVAMATE